MPPSVAGVYISSFVGKIHSKSAAVDLLCSGSYDGKYVNMVSNLPFLLLKVWGVVASISVADRKFQSRSVGSMKVSFMTVLTSECRCAVLYRWHLHLKDLGMEDTSVIIIIIIIIITIIILSQTATPTGRKG